MAHDDCRHRPVAALHRHDTLPQRCAFLIKISPVPRPRFTNKLAVFLIASTAALLAIYLFWSFEGAVKALLERRMGASPSRSAAQILSTVKLFLIGVLVSLF